MFVQSPAPAYHLVAPVPSSDTVEVLEDLLAEARRGEVVGLLFAAMTRRRDYYVGAAGEAHRSPTFARGMVCALDDELRRSLEAMT